MKGDFSRLTFDATKHFSRVMMQQGRVQLDADWNEQHAIFLHYLQTLTKDLIGEYGGPADNLGFKIITDIGDITNHRNLGIDEWKPLLKKCEGLLKDNIFIIGSGRYYVSGIQVTAEDYYGGFDQPDYPDQKQVKLQAGTYLVYLDVWEHHITSLEDASIREVALENVDTASRAKIVWQVKIIPLGKVATRDIAIQELKKLINKPRAYLTADTSQKSTNSEPCTIAPESIYRGQENQLYRVEIYNTENNSPKIKWARDNASLLTGAKLEGGSLTVNDPRGFKPGQWVEITNDEQELLEKSGQLIKIKSIDDNKFALEATIINTDLPNPKVRRWDGADIPAQDIKPIPLADGVYINLKAANTTQGIGYRNGDYWLIPVRVATGKVEWPDEPQPPHGIEHHYAPLAVIEVNAAGAIAPPKDLRNQFKALAEPVSP